MNTLDDNLLNSLLGCLSFLSVQGEPAPDAPFGSEVKKALDFTLDLASSMGFRTENLDGYCGIADIGNGPVFGILGHLDVVPVGKGWTANPRGEIKDGVIYGRGVMDDKGPVLCCLYAVKRLIDEGFVPKRKIRFILGCNEESGWACIDRYNRTEVMPDTGFSPDANFPVINGEKGILHFNMSAETVEGITVKGGERANIVPNECFASLPYTAELCSALEGRDLELRIAENRLLVFVKGVSSHAAHPEQGENAIIKLLSALPFSPIKEFASRLSASDGSAAGIALEDDKSGKLTVNTGVINIENGKFSADMDIRYPVSYDADYVLELVAKNFPEFTLRTDQIQKPLFIDENDDLIRELCDAYACVTGSEAKPVTIGGGTYARALKKGCAFGPELPGRPSTIHMPDECVSVGDLKLIYDIYYEAVKRLCFAPRS